LTHATLGSRASVVKKFNGTGAYIDPAGNVYVVDYANNRVQKFNASGTYLTQWGSPGSGNGQFATPKLPANPCRPGSTSCASSSRVGSR